MTKNTAGEKEIIPAVIRFQGDGFRLSMEDLENQVDANTRDTKAWHWPTLQFQSFHHGKLTLLNTSKNHSYKLVLQVQDNHLLVGCSCGSNQPGICIHAYSGLYVIIFHQGDRYFEKLRPAGLMEMAFAHKTYFDRKESTAGLNIVARPEQQTIYRLAPKIRPIDVPEMMKLPPAPLQEDVNLPKESLAYIIVIAYRHKHLPAVLPCMGVFNKDRTDLKAFYPFLTGIQQEYTDLISQAQQALNPACQQLWKTVEKLPGFITQQPVTDHALEALLAVFDAWKQLIPFLQPEFFVYTYMLYGIKELKERPDKRRLKKITLSTQVPSIKFILSDKGAVYRLEMQVWLNNKLLKDFDAGASMFIIHQQTLYMLSSIRDAAVAEWMHRCGGWITVFKEHYAAFEQDVLLPLQECYLVTRPKARKRKP